MMEKRAWLLVAVLSLGLVIGPVSPAGAGGREFIDGAKDFLDKTTSPARKHIGGIISNWKDGLKDKRQDLADRTNYSEEDMFDIIILPSPANQEPAEKEEVIAKAQGDVTVRVLQAVDLSGLGVTAVTQKKESREESIKLDMQEKIVYGNENLLSPGPRVPLAPDTDEIAKARAFPIFAARALRVTNNSGEAANFQIFIPNKGFTFGEEWTYFKNKALSDGETAVFPVYLSFPLNTSKSEIKLSFRTKTNRRMVRLPAETTIPIKHSRTMDTGFKLKLDAFPNYANEGGRCFGICISTRLWFLRHTRLPGKLFYGTERFSSVMSKLDSVEREEKFAAFYQRFATLTHLGKTAGSQLLPSNDPASYFFLKGSIALGKPGILLAFNEGIGSVIKRVVGHAILAYKIEEYKVGPKGTIMSRVYIYDPNYPHDSEASVYYNGFFGELTPPSGYGYNKNYYIPETLLDDTNVFVTEVLQSAFGVASTALGKAKNAVEIAWKGVSGLAIGTY
ncbi:MAG: hypothetical protein QGH40_04230, partial [bacterium]|nr:hypothetical protein [bacterium]